MRYNKKQIINFILSEIILGENLSCKDKDVWRAPVYLTATRDEIEIDEINQLHSIKKSKHIEVLDNLN